MLCKAPDHYFIELLVQEPSKFQLDYFDDSNYSYYTVIT